MKSTMRLGGLLFAVTTTATAMTNHYLFVSHTRADGPGEIVQREVERIDFSRYDLRMMAGDYTWTSTALQSTVDYIEAVLDLSDPTVFAAMGNHDTSHKSYFSAATGRPYYYATVTNNVAFVVLDTTDDGQDILGDELQMLTDTVNALSNCTHLVLIHHHLIWLADYAPLSYLYDDERIGASSATLSGLNFYDDVYPLLLQAVGDGVEVLCVAGDRTGSDLPGSYGEFHIEHTTAEGIHFLAAGLKEDLPPELRTVITFEHDTEAGTLTWNFVPLSELHRIPDEPLVISELHYNPSAGQGADMAFIEVINRGAQPYDLSEATFAQGVGFTFPTNVIAAPGERILIAANQMHYTNLGVRVFDYEGVAPPVIGEPIWLRDRDYLEIDYVPYGVSAPWPPQPDGSGASLMLIHPELDNELPQNWAASDGDGGTPGALNFASVTCTNIAVAGSQIITDWAGAISGALYQLEWAPSLVSSAWLAVGDETNAAGTHLLLSVTNTAPAGFFRLKRVFPVYPPPVYTNLISLGSIWKYRDTGDDPGPDWMMTSYDDSGWASGPAELGYGDGDEATVVSYGPDGSGKYATTHFRCHFNVDDPALVDSVLCNVKVDDGAIFYLNGTEVERVRMQTGTVTYQDYTTMGGSEYAFEPISIPASGFIAGDNVLAVEVHQASGTSSDISLDAELSVSVIASP